MPAIKMNPEQRTRPGFTTQRRIMSKIASGRFGSNLLTATYKNTPAKEMANM